ncbi:MAG: mannose-6-phosphate isomerase, class I [candidate division KSB1 bacterium]|nr:mannose-6-phosphate isomerase, class I [candidate division KSB1 bacterium]
MLNCGWERMRALRPELNMNGRYVPLSRLVEQFPVKILGSEVSRRFNNTLPFLFKVLSIGEPLSIQAHPNKEQAVTLFERDPVHYPDSNHKPEIAVALDHLTALVGLKPIDDILYTLEKYPEFVHFLGRGFVSRWMKVLPLPVDRHAGHIKTLIVEILHQSEKRSDDLARILTELYQRLCQQIRDLDNAEKLFVKLWNTYRHGDVGLVFVFLLQIMNLNAGDAIFLRAGLPHAYVSGNIIECMANSDNVVRVGLTPKYKDVQTLADIIDCDPAPLTVLSDKGMKCAFYETPVDDFDLEKIRLGSQKIVTKNRPEILLITEGEIKLTWRQEGPHSASFGRGQSVFIPACLDEYGLEGIPEATVFRASTPEAI